MNIIWHDDAWQGFYKELQRHPFVAEQRTSEQEEAPQ